MRVGLRRKLGNCRRCGQSCALKTPEARQRQGSLQRGSRGGPRGGRDLPIIVPRSRRRARRDSGSWPPTAHLPSPCRRACCAAPSQHALHERAERSRWPPASYAAERPLCSRVPASHSAFFFTDFGVCVLAGSTNDNLVLAAMILVLTPFSSPWSPPACNHPNARHLSLGV